MTITIELTPEEETQLLAKAGRQKQPPEGVVHSLVHQGLFSSPPPIAIQGRPISETLLEERG